MSLLVLDRVTKRYVSGRREQIALRAVSLEVAAGELVAVWGTRRSGRSTLLRVAAGIEAPDEGTVHFAGHRLRTARAPLGDAIGYASLNFVATQGASVIEQVAVGLLAGGDGLEVARRRALEALERVGMGSAADIMPSTLDPAEQVRVAIARAIAAGPRLLLVDDPANGVDVLQRDPLLALIRSIADSGTAVLMTVGEVVTVADRALAIDHGELRGDVVPQGATVIPLRPSA